MSGKIFPSQELIDLTWGLSLLKGAKSAPVLNKTFRAEAGPDRPKDPAANFYPGEIIKEDNGNDCCKKY
jgi:hypothetical protein